MKHVSEYFSIWGLGLSMTKTVAVLITRRKDNPDSVKLYVHHSEVKVERKAKFIGVVFEDKLSLAPHIDYVVDRCKSRLNMMRAISGTTWSSSKTVVKTVYIALIRSILDYGSLAFDCATNEAKEKLDAIHGQALRICAGAMPGTSRAALPNDLGELPLHLRRRMLQAQYAVRVENTTDQPDTAVFQDCWQLHYGSYQK